MGRRSRSNPYARPYPADWHDWSPRQKASWRRRNWIAREGDRPRSFEQRAASRLARGNPSRRNPGVFYVWDLITDKMVPFRSLDQARTHAVEELGWKWEQLPKAIFVQPSPDADLVPLYSLPSEQRRSLSNPNKRGRYYVRDEWLGEMVELPSVRSAARFARSRLGDLGDIYVEADEQLVPLKSLRTGGSRTNPYSHEHAARLIDPRRMIKTSFRRKNVKGGSIGLIFGKRTRRGPMVLQAVRFRAAHFTVAQARSWLRRHMMRQILFEAATKGRKAAWKAEGARLRRSGRSRRHRRVA